LIPSLADLTAWRNAFVDTPAHVAWKAEMARRQEAYEESRRDWSVEIERPEMRGR
jgi:hypothetical protein